MNNIKTWMERMHEDSGQIVQGDAMAAEIADLRTALASQASKGAGVQPIYQSRSLRGISPGGWFDSANKAEWEKAQDHPAYEHRVVYSAAQAQPVAITGQDKIDPLTDVQIEDLAHHQEPEAQPVADIPSNAMVALKKLKLCIEIGTGCMEAPDSKVLMSFEDGWSGTRFTEFTYGDLKAISEIAEQVQPVADAAPTIPPILMKHVEGVRFVGNHSVQIIMNDVDVIRQFIATTERALAAKPAA